MKTKRMRVLEWSGWSLITAIVLLLGISSAQAAGEIGKTIDKTNVAQYKNMLIPALYRAVESGDFILPTGNLGFVYKHSDAFLKAGEKNAGKFAVNSQGDLVDKATGKIPFYNIYGYPFPHIDPKDPQAGDKIMWNFIFQKYRFMCVTRATQISFITKAGKEERNVRGVASEYFVQGRPPGQEVKNPDNLAELTLKNVMEPMSMRGTNTLTWLYWDERDIYVYNYVPVIRRVRQTSGASRSDSYLGSDAWTDIGYGWAGKNRTMKWKLVGEKTILVPFSNKEKTPVQVAADGSMTGLPVDRFGYHTQGWKGAPWAPTSAIFVPRQVWVIEQMPKDRYYAWGLHVKYVDKDTCSIWYNEVHDKAGVFRTWDYITYYYGEDESGRNTTGAWNTNVVIDEKVRHATLFITPPSRDNRTYIPNSRISTNYYSMNNFLQLSK